MSALKCALLLALLALILLQIARGTGHDPLRLKGGFPEAHQALEARP